jgi:hypothetical protein
MTQINLKGKVSTWTDTEMTCDRCERALKANDRVITLALRVTPGSVKSYVHWDCRRGTQTLVNSG